TVEVRTMTKKICIITMIGGTDIIGELEAGDGDTAALWRPCLLRFNPPNNMQLVELLRGSPFFTGEYLELNMRAVQWVGQPAKEVAAAYRNIKSGLVLPLAQPAARNQ